MEDTDDDFGELYADLEVQASSSINSLHCISELCIEKTNVNNDAIGSGFHKLDSTGDDDADKVSSPDAKYDKEVIVDSGSDSEDDLNILLNDDGDSPSFPVNCGANLRGGGYEDEEEENTGGLMEGSGSDKNRKCIDQSQMGDGLEHSSSCVGGGERGNGGKCVYHSQYKYIRPHPEAMNNSKGNGCAGIGSYASVSGIGEQKDNGCNQHTRSSSVVAQRKHTFSLPRSRTILDVNINAFGYKPWRLPEADITDYFNFGFNEDSWKHYCNKLDQCRHGEYMSTKILAAESCKTNEACEAVLEERIVPSSMTNLSEQNCRAIQVEDSILDRQPSTEVMRPLYRDSDVIQITLQDSKGESSGSLKGISALVDCSEFEMSENGDSEHDDGDNRCFDRAGEVELQREFLSRQDKGVDKLVAKRHTQQPKACKAVHMDSDNYGGAYMSDDGYHQQEVEFNASNETIEAMEIGNHTKEKVKRMSRTRRRQHSPNSSSSGHVKRPLPNSAKLWDSVASDYYHSTESRNRGAKTREGDCKYYGKQNQSQVYTNNHNRRRINGGFKPQTHLNEDDFCSLSNSSFDDCYHRKDPYYRESEHSFNYHGRSPRRNVHQSFGVENEEYLGRNLDEEEYFIDKRMSRMDDELMARDWFRYERRLDVEDMDPIIYKERSSYLNHEIGVQRKRKSGDLQFRRRIKDDLFFLEEQLPNDFPRDRNEKPVPHDGYDENLRYNTQILERIDGRNRSPSIVYDDLRSMDEEDEFWIFRDRRAFSSHSRAEAHNSPINDLYERHTKYKREIRTERSRESGWCGIYSDAFDIEENIDNRDNDVVRFGRRHYWKSEVLHWTEDEIAPFPFQRNLRPKMFNDKHDDDEGQVEWHRSKFINQGNRGNRFGRSSNIMCRGNHDQTFRRCKNSIRERKFLGRFSARGSIYNKAKPESFTWNINVEKKTSGKSKEPATDKVPQTNIPKLEQPNNINEKLLIKFLVGKDKEALDIEEGQIIAEEINGSNENIRPSNKANKVAEASSLKEMHNKNASEGNTGIQVKKSSRILEVIAKMEKRRERFKEPVSLKDRDQDPNPNPEITPKPLGDPVGERVDMKQKRPARKRRWVGN